MAILQWTTPDGCGVTLNVRRESTVVMLNNETSYTFDYEGRLIGAFRDGKNYRRSLSNEILVKTAGPRPGLSGRLRRMLTHDEIESLETEAYATLRALAPQAAQAASDDVRATTLEALERIGRYDYPRLEAERQVMRRLYRPVTILPPDQYLALYLQATEGCSFNACSFCGLYRDRRFRVKSVDEFRSHIDAVRGFMGGALSLRRSVFLGDANALLLPQETLCAYLDQVNAQFAILPRGLAKAQREAWEAEHPLHMQGIYAFIDAFSTRRKTADDFAALAARGLRRVYVGLETGDGGLLHFLGKPNTPMDVLHLVQHIKAGGVSVGIIVLIGAGGDKFQDQHVRGTTQILNRMPLAQDDLIYFSELVDYPGSTYSQRAADAGVRTLSPGEIEHQMVRIRGGLQFNHPETAPRISFYDVREFVY